jgi:hypothetical protein
MLIREEGVTVEDNIISAIWYIWYKKVQFTMVSETDKLSFITRSFLSISIKLIAKNEEHRDDKLLWNRAWRIYNNVIDYIYGNTMDRHIEDRSKALLACMISEFEFQQKTTLVNYIELGLTKDTAEYDLFQKAYTDNTIKLGAKPRSQ